MKIDKLLSEFKAEIEGTSPSMTKAIVAFATGTGKKSYNAIKNEKGQWMIDDKDKAIPPHAKAEVLDVLRYVGKNLKAFAKPDISVWDITSGTTGIEVIDDSGKRYKMAFRR